MRIERELDDRSADRARRGRGRSGGRSPRARPRCASSRPKSRAASSRRCCRARPTPTTATSRSMPAPAAPRARTGPACCCACIRAGPSSTATRSSSSKRRRRRGRHQVGDHPDQGRQRLWLAQDRIRRAPPGAHLALRFQCAAAHVLRLRLGLSGRRRHHRDRDQRSRRAAIDTMRVGRRRRPARQQDRIRGAPHPHSDRHRRRLPERALAAPQPRQSLADAARQALRGGAEEARGKGQRPIRPPRPTSAGATRSAPTCCSPTRW